MPIIKSAKKRVKVAAKARARNLHTKREMRTALKAFTAALEGGKPAEVAKAQAAAQSAIDGAAKKNVIHKNKAARFKSRLASQAKTAGMKAAKTTTSAANIEKGKGAAKAAVKKPVAKKAAAKKPVKKSKA